MINAIVGCSGVEHDRARQALRRLSALAGDAASALADGDDRPVGRGAGRRPPRPSGRCTPASSAPAHEAAIDVARALGAAGWKVNGAGGDGGSLTVVAGSGPATATAAELAAALVAARPGLGGRRPPTVEPGLTTVVWIRQAGRSGRRSAEPARRRLPSRR